MAEMMTPNNLEIVRKELATISHFENGFEIPEQVQATPKNNHYHLIGLRTSTGPNPRQLLYRAKHICIDINQYRKLERQKKQGILNELFGGTWQEIFVLHDPTKKAAKKKPEVKNLSPQNKGKVKTMFGDGMSAEDIAAELNQPLNAVEKYINEKLK